MHPIDVQTKLKKKGISQADIARKLDVSEHAVSLVVRQIMTSARIMAAVAEAVGIDERVVFAKHYAAKARRENKKPTRRQQAKAV